MSDSLGDILQAKSRYQEPPEVQIIKTFVQEKYQVTPRVTVRPKEITITVKSAALAGTLRMRLHELRDLCQSEKPLILRIG